METKPVDIIIVTYNNWVYTKLFLDSLRQYTKIPYRVICIDNASTDETKNEIVKYEEVKLLSQAVNLGYGKAVNLGFKEVKSSKFVLLNNDIVVSPNWLENWLKIFDDNPDYWQLSTNSNCVIDSKNSFTGVDFDSWEEHKNKHQNESPEILFNSYYQNYQKFCLAVKEEWGEKIEDVKAPEGFLGGWAILMRTETVKIIGGFLYDERFPFGFYEDVDLSWRIGLAGGKVGIARGIYLHHFVNTTFDSMNLKKQLISRHNKWRFFDKWEDFIIKGLQTRSNGNFDKLKELMETNKQYFKFIEYQGMKAVLGKKNYTEIETG